MADKTRQDDDLMSDAALDALLGGLKTEAPEPSAALLGRVLGDAYEMQPEPAAAPAADRPSEPHTRARFLAQLVSVFGGWGGVGGLAVAASVGFFMGFSPPALLEETLPDLLGYDLTLGLDEAGFGWDSVEDAL